MHSRGLTHLYSHQATAFESIAAGQHTVVVTPTASGKTLCYNLPVLNAMLADPGARAIYLFPTKALAQDQYTGLQALIEASGADIKTYPYDGDTPAAERQTPEISGTVVATTPQRKRLKPSCCSPATKPGPAEMPTTAMNTFRPTEFMNQTVEDGIRPKVGRTDRSHPKKRPAMSAPPAVDSVSGTLPIL